MEKPCKETVWLLFVQPPSPIPVVDHLPGHAAVDADVFAGDEARLVRTEEQHHVGDVHGIAHPTGRLLRSVRPLVYPVRRINPAGGDRIDPHPPSEADGERVGQGRNPALGGGVAFGLRLAHAVSGGGDVDDDAAGGEVRRKQLAQIERRRDAHGQRVLKFLVGALVNPLHQRQGIVDQEVDVPVPVENGLDEGFQRFLFADVPDVMFARRDVDDLHRRALGPKGFGDRLPDAVRAARDDGDLSCKGCVHGAILLLRL